MSHTDVALGEHHTPVMEPSPFAFPAIKLAMWLFIISDIMTFAACLVAYGFLRNATPNWPRPFQSSTITSIMVMTLILITSSFIMVLAVGRTGRPGERLPLDDGHAGGGSAFAILHIHEWSGISSVPTFCLLPFVNY